ncbi:MAG: SPOR domain-containing protein [Pseudomonadota bacterium]
MADFTFNGASPPWMQDDVTEHSDVTQWLNWAGALVSLALLVGLGSWGWQLMKRDVSGVPVVQALEGPMRIAPDDPGGLSAEHQGLAVNRIAAEGSVEPPEETIVLAPAPVGLAEEDKPAAALEPEPVAAAAEPAISAMRLDNSLAQAVEDVATAPAEGETGIAMTATPANPTDMAVAEALANIMAGELDGTPGATDAVATAPAADGLAASPLPKARPGTTAVVENVAALTSANVPADAIPAGTRLVQLGAFENAILAEAAWTETESLFADYMVGKAKVIQEAETGGLTFYRLRAAGFSDLADARRFCSVLVAGDVNCIPVVQR